MFSSERPQGARSHLLPWEHTARRGPSPDRASTLASDSHTGAQTEKLLLSSHPVCTVLSGAAQGAKTGCVRVSSRCPRAGTEQAAGSWASWASPPAVLKPGSPSDGAAHWVAGGYLGSCGAGAGTALLSVRSPGPRPQAARTPASATHQQTQIFGLNGGSGPSLLSPSCLSLGLSNQV